MGIGKSGSSKTSINRGRFQAFLSDKASLLAVRLAFSAIQLPRKSLINRGIAASDQKRAAKSGSPYFLSPDVLRPDVLRPNVLVANVFGFNVFGGYFFAAAFLAAGFFAAAFLAAGFFAAAASSGSL